MGSCGEYFSYIYLGDGEDLVPHLKIQFMKIVINLVDQLILHDGQLAIRLLNQLIHLLYSIYLWILHQHITMITNLVQLLATIVPTFLDTDDL